MKSSNESPFIFPVSDHTVYSHNYLPVAKKNLSTISSELHIIVPNQMYNYRDWCDFVTTLYEVTSDRYKSVIYNTQ